MIKQNYPLIDLHRHLDGNIRPKTIWQLANNNNITLPVNNFDAFIPYVQIQHSEPDLLAFLKKLDWGVAVLKSLDDCKRVALENVEDAFVAGLDYAELRFSPYYMAMNHNLPVADVVAAVVDGVKAGMKQYGVKINLIGILSRTFGVDKCQLELDALLTHKDDIVGIDLAGDELHFPGELFVEHFKKAKAAGLHITVHAGEAVGSESVWQAIKGLNAERIGHGVAAAQDVELMDYMAKHNIAIESCLTSNFQTGTVHDLTKHPIKTFLKHGVPAFLNTDDPAVEGIEIKDEFDLAQQQLGFSQQAFNQLQENALNACFLSDSEKKELLVSAQNK